jgi:hypothetical protein
MSAIEDVFSKVVGRQASELERERLYRLREALGLSDNDAFWGIIMALEYYDSFFRRYPRQVAEETAKTIEGARAAFALAAEKEAAQVHRMLSQQVAQTSVEIARKLAERPFALHRVTVVLAAVVGFGALCVGAGYGWAEAGPPFWIARSGEMQGAARILSAVLGVPAGWMVFALILPAAVHGTRVGWAAASEETAASSQRVLGWILAILSIAGSVACASMLAKVLR